MSTDNSEKSKALEATIAKIRKDFGDESIMDMGAEPPQVESYSTGVLPLDVALGIGGIPKGRIIELFGPESSGKTTLAYHMMAEVQRSGGVAAFVDTEHAMDARYAANLGLKIEDLLVSQPDCGEDAMNIVDTMAKSGAVDLIVVDSVAALTPRAELEGAMGDSSVGVLARLMSQGCRKLIASCNQKGTTIVFINQIREKIGVMFGSPETQPGGRALKFYSSVRLDIRRIETIKDGGEATANRVRVKVVKNKVANPFTQAEFNIHFGTGADNLGALIDLALEHDLDMVQKSGSFIKIDGHQEQGKAKATNYLRETPEVAAKLDAEIRSKLLPGYQPSETTEVDVEEQPEPAEEELAKA